MFTSFGKVLDLLTPRHRRMFWVLLALMILTTFAEVGGLSVFVVLLNMLADPEQIAQRPFLSALYDGFGFTSLISFQIAMSVAVAVVFMLGLAIKATSTFAIMRFSAFCAYSISWRLLERYLAQPYVWSLDRNSSELSKSILADAEQVSHKIVTPSLKILANVLLAISITGFLVIQDPLIAGLAFVLIGGGYAAIYWLVRVRLRTQGANIMEANRLRFRLATEATNGLKEIKLGSFETSYIGRFRGPGRIRRDQVIKQQMITEVPRFALEALTFFFLMAVVFVLLVRNDGNLVAAIPTLGIFVFAIMRLLPAVQQVYAGLASLKAGEAVVDLLHNDFTTLGPKDDSAVPDQSMAPLTLEDNLSFDTVSYRYPKANRQAISELSLRIEANSTVGIVGGTGAGKTTVIDLALGLLRPDTGKILIDGSELASSNLRAWQKAIGYVPQHIYLTDDTLAANIAFGIPKEKMDHASILRAAKVAAMHDFVQNELPDGYDTQVGERGVRLSGGQRQRIGIARALYHNPSLLILDEATSALDTLTEVAVMDAVHNLHGQKTVILIAHRLSTVQECDRIFLMENGRVAAAGRYDDLVEKNDAFRRMVTAGLLKDRLTPGGSVEQDKQ